jgi:hypothetical protein
MINKNKFTYIDFTKIPYGCYCYDENGTCPYWDSDPSKGEQRYGYCHCLGVGDWEDNEHIEELEELKGN